MKQKFLCAIAICLPFFVFCQSNIPDTGIKWSQGLNWKQVLQKAQKENKYVFVDCYATWCVPCKKMDKQAYTNDTVGNFFNEKIIAYYLFLCDLIQVFYKSFTEITDFFCRICKCFIKPEFFDQYIPDAFPLIKQKQPFIFTNDHTQLHGCIYLAS